MFPVSWRSAWIPAYWMALKIPESVFSFTLLIAAVPALAAATTLNFTTTSAAVAPLV